jgi:hypothetical protein
MLVLWSLSLIFLAATSNGVETIHGLARRRSRIARIHHDFRA